MTISPSIRSPLSHSSSLEPDPTTAKAGTNRLAFAPTQPMRLRPHPLNPKQTSVVAGQLRERAASGPATLYVALAHLAHARGACSACKQRRSRETKQGRAPVTSAVREMRR
jgi:hypothetical protein